MCMHYRCVPKRYNFFVAKQKKRTLAFCRLTSSAGRRQRSGDSFTERKLAVPNDSKKTPGEVRGLKKLELRPPFRSKHSVLRCPQWELSFRTRIKRAQCCRDAHRQNLTIVHTLRNEARYSMRVCVQFDTALVFVHFFYRFLASNVNHSTLRAFYAAIYIFHNSRKCWTLEYCCHHFFFCIA